MLYLTPRSCYHVFSRHQDTQHEIKTSGLSWSGEHHHCDLWKADMLPVSDEWPVAISLFPRHPLAHLIRLRMPELTPAIHQPKTSNGLRAPPLS